MKNIKISWLYVAVLGGMLACGANAQDAKEGKKGDKGGRRGFTVEARMDRMTEELKLTDEQKPKVKAVLEDGSKKMQDLRNDSSTPEERREKFASLRKEEDKKLKEILTSEQYTKWEKMREEMGRKGGKKKDGAGKGDDTKKE